MQPGTSETRLGPSASHPAAVVGFAPGTALAERYRVVAMVGRGGMGEVYRADDLRLGQPVALKFLPAALEHDSVARDRLLAEVRNARTVSHPNVCRVYDIGDVQGRYFLTMEYIDGEDLASLLRRIGRLPAAKALEIARQLCAGLAAAHDKGVLHRDLKPANVMIDGRGHARITDFGLALRLADDLAPARSGQAVGVVEVAGTVAYLAPERFEGQPATVQSDLYALGLVLYEVYTGKPALTATTVEGWRRAHSDSTPSHPSAIVAEIEPAVERAILRCLEKDPARRPVSAAQLAASLPGGDPLAAAIVAGETPSPELVAASGEEGTLPRWQAWTWLGTTIASLALAIAALASVSLHNVVPTVSPEEQRVTARQILQSLGYREAPGGESVWWTDASGGYGAEPSARSAADWFDEPARAVPGPMRFCYRQSPGTLFDAPSLGADRPPISTLHRRPGEAYLELDSTARLVALRVIPDRRGMQATPAPDWSVLFRAARCDERQFHDTASQQGPEDPFDARLARAGTCEGQPVRIDAAAFGGRVIWFQLESARPERAPVAPERSLYGLVIRWLVVLFGLLAWRNYAAGRGDRRGAWRLALVLGAASYVGAACRVSWPVRLESMVTTVTGFALVLALTTWAFYLGFEPPVRRRWPHLLISWARLLDGRWRDPLVGRAILAGLVSAAVAAFLRYGPLIVGRALGWPGARQYEPTAPLLSSVASWTGYILIWTVNGCFLALSIVGALALSRAALRSNVGAWLGALMLLLSITMFIPNVAPGTPYALFVGATIARTALWLLVTAHSGLLALVVGQIAYCLVQNVPWTLDSSRWFFWRTVIGAVVLAAVAVWGFSNTLGKQSMFPAEE